MQNNSQYINSLLGIMEEFCHPLTKELDHCAVMNGKKIQIGLVKGICIEQYLNIAHHIGRSHT